MSLETLRSLGYQYSPTDQHLIENILKSMIMEEELPPEIRHLFPVVDIYGTKIPSEIFDNNYPRQGLNFFGFTRLQLLNGKFKRTAGKGVWKCQRHMEVKGADGQVIGVGRVYSFCVDKIASHWIMYEYSTASDALKEGHWVLFKIFFNRKEWEKKKKRATGLEEEDDEMLRNARGSRRRGLPVINLESYDMQQHLCSCSSSNSNPAETTTVVAGSVVSVVDDEFMHAHEESSNDDLFLNFTPSSVDCVVPPGPQDDCRSFNNQDATTTGSSSNNAMTISMHGVDSCDPNDTYWRELDAWAAEEFEKQRNLDAWAASEGVCEDAWVQ